MGPVLWRSDVDRCFGGSGHTSSTHPQHEWGILPPQRREGTTSQGGSVLNGRVDHFYTSASGSVLDGQWITFMLTIAQHTASVFIIRENR